MTSFIESMDMADKDRRSGLDRVMVLGLGGCGCDIVGHLANCGLKGPKLIAADSDSRALDRCPAPHKILLGSKASGGTGSGGDPRKGAAAAEESMHLILEALKGAAMVFIAAGLGGGAGTGAVQAVAKAIYELPWRLPLVAVVLLPFSVERERLETGKRVLPQLERHCQSVIHVYNDMLAKCFPKRFHQAGESSDPADDALLQAAKRVADMIRMEPRLGIDMFDIKTVLSHSGQAVMVCAEGTGEDRAAEVAEMAIGHPLMAVLSVASPKGLLVNINSDDDILFAEFVSVIEAVVNFVGGDCDNLSSLSIDNSLKENRLMRMTAIAIGLELDESLMGLEVEPKRPARRGAIKLAEGSFSWRE